MSLAATIGHQISALCILRLLVLSRLEHPETIIRQPMSHLDKWTWSVKREKGKYASVGIQS